MTDAPDAVPAAEVERPAAPTAEDAKPKRRFRIGCLGCAVCLFFAFVFLCIGVKSWMVIALNSRVAALRAAGEPTTWAEVVADYEPVPDEDNMELRLVPLMDPGPWMLDTPTTEIVVHYLHPLLGVQCSPEARVMMRAFLAENAESLAVLHQITQRPDGRWPLVSTGSVPDEYHFPWETVETVSPYLWFSGELLTVEIVAPAARALGAEAAVHAAEGEGHRAAQAVFALRRMAGSLDQYPHLVAQRCRASLGLNACLRTEYVLSRCELSAQDLTMLRTEVEAEADQLSLRSAVHAARAGALWASTEGRGSVFKAKWREGQGKFLTALPGLVEMEALCGLNYTTKWLAALDLEPRERLVRMAEMEENLIPNHDAVMEPRYVAGLGLSMLDSAALTREFILARQALHIARAALAVEQFRIERGRWPEKLTDLVPDYLAAVPEDLLAPKGSAIAYKRTATGVRLWSRHPTGWGVPGLTHDEMNALVELAEGINRFKESKRRLPASLSELDAKEYGHLLMNPHTNRPYAYVTNPANPELFILGGFTNGMSEDKFWGQTIRTRQLVCELYNAGNTAVTFRLLDPKLRGATQARFNDEFCGGFIPELAFHKLGYTPERLKELGFNEDVVKNYKSNLEWIKEEVAREREDLGLPPDSGVSPDTEAAPAP
jgi:hypothetical protein